MIIVRNVNLDAEKCREMCEKFKEMQRNADILMTFMTFMAQGNVIFDILEPHAFKKNSTCWVF